MTSVTIVIPNYNHSKYLRECLDSVHAQTRQPERVIVIDDASTDSSVEIIEEFIRQNPSWELIRMKINRGVLFGLNAALAMITTDWVSCLAADDILHPEYLERVMELISQIPRAALVCACAEQFGAVGGRTLRPIVAPRATAGFLSPDEFRGLLRRADNFFLGTVTVYRCKALRELGGFDAELGSLADGILGRRIAVRHGFGFIPKVLGYWRIHGENYSTTTSTDARKVAVLLRRVEAVLTAEPSGLFPNDYVCLFNRRQRFGGVRLLLNASLPRAVRAEQIAALMQVGKGQKAGIRWTLGFGRLGSIAVLGWAVLFLRPVSLGLIFSNLKENR